MPPDDLVDRLALIFQRIAEIQAFKMEAQSTELNAVRGRFVRVHRAARYVTEHQQILVPHRLVEPVFLFYIVLASGRKRLVGIVKVAGSETDQSPSESHNHQCHWHDDQQSFEDET